MDSVYTDLQKLNRDAVKWLDTVANRRRHGTHGELINGRWQKEIPLYWPRYPGTAAKVTRKVYKDCQLSYNGNRHPLPHDRPKGHAKNQERFDPDL